MIKSFRHKGLDASLTVKDMALPGFKLHKLSGKKKDIWSAWVNGNWRVTFYFEEGDAFIVDYRDYH
jgi:toxin HigB-1